MICCLDDVITQFIDNQDLAIDYSTASEDQILELEEILNERTNARPHDDESFSEHMLHYRPEGYVYLAYDGHVVSSYAKGAKDCRREFIKLEDVLALEAEDKESFSESDFDSVF